MGGFTFSLTDSVALSDTISEGLGFGPSDRIKFLDVPTSEIDPGHRYFLQDNLNLTDILAVAFTNSPLLTDTLALSDQPSIGRGFSFPDTLALSDSVLTSLDSVFLALAQAVFDSIALGDSIQLFEGESKGILGDAINFADSVRVNIRSIPISYLRRYLNDVQ